MTILEAPGGASLGVPVSGEVFRGHSEASFWIGEIATYGNIGNAELFDATAKLRANVYVNEMEFLSSESVDAAGRELDEDDGRAIHLAVVENSRPGLPDARVIGASRLIVKNNVAESPLPVEGVFPEVFNDNPIVLPAVEVSRFISRHDNGQLQHAIAISLIRAMTFQVKNRGIDSAYFVIERPLLKVLQLIGLPLEVMGDSKEIEEPGGVRKLFPIKITPSTIIESVTKDGHNRLVLNEFFKNESINGGEGYYPLSLTGGSK